MLDLRCYAVGKVVELTDARGRECGTQALAPDVAEGDIVAQCV